MEYGATVWDPYQNYNSDKVEMVQRRAVRFVKGRSFDGVLVEAYKGTRRKHYIKFRQIGHTTSQYEESFSP